MLPACGIPGTPLRMGRTEDGARAGEWLFDESTVIAAPRFLAGIANKPLVSSLGWDSWTTTLPQLTGPFLPARLTAAVPAGWQTLWRGLPIWKWAMMALGACLAWFVLARIHRWTARAPGPHAAPLRMVMPLLTLIALQVFLPWFKRQLMPFSQMPDIVAHAVTLLSFAALAWLFWATVQAFVAIRSTPEPNPKMGRDRDLWRVMGAAAAPLAHDPFDTEEMKDLVPE